MYCPSFSLPSLFEADNGDNTFSLETVVVVVVEDVTRSKTDRKMGQLSLRELEQLVVMFAVHEETESDKGIHCKEWRGSLDTNLFSSAVMEEQKLGGVHHA